ncbi:MAG: glutamyl-tRNA reductase [Streptosporangiaceae bacterium]
MSLLVVGLSHASAPVAVLERAVLGDESLGKLLRDVHQAQDVAGSAVLSTCNRVEVYADVDTFHGGVAAISELLSRHTGIPLAELTAHLYVHYADRAVQHLLAVACGLESMVVGENQILGQVRRALRIAQEQGTLSRSLSEVGSLALRTGKRAHTQTAIDQAGRSLVSEGLAAALHVLERPALDGVPVLVVGAGSMSSLAATTAARSGAVPLVIANRTDQHARRLAAAVGGTAASLSGLVAQIAAADLVITCTGATGQVISAATVGAALALRERGRTLVLLDLALPRDVEPEVARLPGVSIIGLAELAQSGAGEQSAVEVAQVRQIVAEEFAAQASARRATLVTPTVLALRAKAAAVVEAEISRLAGRLSSLDDRSRREIAQAMHRIADKILHAPTVRVKELAGSPGAESYEAALRVLFDLDPAAVRAVISLDAALAGWPAADAAAPRPAERPDTAEGRQPK